MYRLVVAAMMFVAVTVSAMAQAAPPATDIFLAPIAVKDGRPVIGMASNLTNRPGYDNQPAFTPDGRSILFTSIREDAQADIYRITLATGVIARVTSTPESEYSATVMPGGTRFSVIRVEKDSAQRLWSFAMDGSDPKVLIESLKPVGYHAWIDGNNLALYVLGRPNALVHTDLRTGKSDTLARDIGRSLLPLPDKSGFSFLQMSGTSATLTAMHWPGLAATPLTALPPTPQDVVWLTNDLVLTGVGTKVLYWRRGAILWEQAGDLAAGGLTEISRLAVSPDGKWLALVAIPK